MKSDISKIIYNETDLDQAQADDLAGLIAKWVEGERCEWTPYYPDDEENDSWNTGCGQEIYFEYPDKEPPYPFCPCCGRKIEVKEKEDE